MSAPRTVEELLVRATSALGHKTKYDLGAGGFNPDSPHPWDADGGLDCSGYQCWNLGVSRKTKNPLYLRFNGGWINTDAIKADAVSNAPGGLFTRVDKATPGVLVVYGKNLAVGRNYGHIGLVTESTAVGEIARVLHCSSGNYRKTGDALGETGPLGVFDKSDQILCVYDPMTILPVETFRTWVFIMSSSLNLRLTPNTDQLPRGSLKLGERAVIGGITRLGQNVDGNSTWYQTVDGLWLWAGGTDNPYPKAAT